MKRITLGINKKKNNQKKRFIADYYQASVNSYGKKQFEALIEKGITLHV